MKVNNLICKCFISGDYDQKTIDDFFTIDHFYYHFTIGRGNYENNDYENNDKLQNSFLPLFLPFSYSICYYSSVLSEISTSV